ncbi:MAG: ATP phosphoribosyltransferase regulatory subunit [Lachnospiraceae bacterium]|nr:ATP phosphoribosyltransferase regulatory subunit [Lachnospiraceae bacterium]
MNNNFYHPELLQTPEGVRDIYGKECAMKNIIKDNISRVIRSYGFDNIETPSFEYFDIFNKERGSALPNEMFKFFDRDNNTLVLRPDITPSVARCVAKYYENETMPVRLCYCGNSYVNNYSHQGKLKETTQLGAELINDETSDADAEMIVMTIESLLSCGLTEFQIDVGHVGIFNGLVKEAGLNPVQIKELRDLLISKNVFAASQYLSELSISENLMKLFVELPQSFGSKEYLALARAFLPNEEATKALDRLDNIYSVIETYGYSQYVNIDPGLLSSYTYYTGVIFRAYTFGTGEPVATGGRYDSLLSQFGHDGAAIGFVICIDQLMLAIKRQNIDISKPDPRILVLYGSADRMVALKLVTKLRSDGMRICIIRKSSSKGINDYKEYCMRNNIGLIIDVEDSERTNIINIADNTQAEVLIEEICGKEEEE